VQQLVPVLVIDRHGLERSSLNGIGHWGMPNRRPPLGVTKVMLLLGRAHVRSWILVGDQVMMPADLERLHKELREFERSMQCRAVIEELWPELVPRLPPKEVH
jgi:hypothetical protein